MRKDFQIAILLALAAIPAGVALMAAPEYIGVLKEYPAPFFWGGLILAVGLIGAAIVIALRGEASEPRSGHRRRMIALVSMIVFGLGFVGSAAVYFWPHAKPWKHSLEDLYATDTNGLGNLERNWEVGVSNPDKGLQRTTLFLRFRLYLDFNSNIDYISIFIPETHNALIDEQIYGLIKWLRDQIPPFRKDLQNSVGVGTSRPGVPYAEAKDMKFSGRVFIYTMNNFTLVQLGELTSWYKAADMDLQIRGYDYWIAHKDR
jgi:hypothetical protein